MAGDTEVSSQKEGGKGWADGGLRLPPTSQPGHTPFTPKIEAPWEPACGAGG